MSNKTPAENPYQTLLLISEEINSTHNISILLDRIMDLALDAVNAERGFILLQKPGSKNYETVTARNFSRERIQSLRDHSSSVVQKVLQTREPLISVDAQQDARFGGAESIVLQQIHSVICTPLIFRDRMLGAIYMDRRMTKHEFSNENLQFLRAFTNQAAVAIQNAQLFTNLENENKKLRDTISQKMLFPEIIGDSTPMQRIFDMITNVAPTTATVLIEGESGTGKELIARAIHTNSPRKEKPFIPIFCGSLSENLLESELFGHKKGAFTGANEHRAGLFEEADGGTVFLDEIGEISQNMQTKLLRVIQEGEIKRVGDTTIRKVDVRILSATNRTLEEEVKQGNFREDLFYRLNVITLQMPPLRQRGTDILLLAEHFLTHYALKNKKNFHGFSAEARSYLRDYGWPGNVRELENTVERAVILCNDPVIGPDVFQLHSAEHKIPLGKSLKEINRYAIKQTLKLADGNRTKAAQILDVSRRWLQYQLKELGMTDADQES